MSEIYNQIQLMFSLKCKGKSLLAVYCQSRLLACILVLCAFLGRQQLCHQSSRKVWQQRRIIEEKEENFHYWTPPSSIWVQTEGVSCWRLNRTLLDWSGWILSIHSLIAIKNNCCSDRYLFKSTYKLGVESLRPLLWISKCSLQLLDIWISWRQKKKR